MLCQEGRRRNVQRHLRRFLETFASQADKTRTKFFFQAVGGIVQAGSLIVRRWCRWIHDRCRQPFYRQKRLLEQLKSGDWDHRQLLDCYQHWAAGMVEPDTALIVDLSDLAKPYARKLPHLALVRDGSDPDHKLVNGYWCIEVYARLNKHRLMPLVLHPYSIEDPAVLSENDMVLQAVEQVRNATGSRGVVVMDIGGDRIELLRPWVQQQVWFVIRQRGDRMVLLDGGVRMLVRDVAEKLMQQSGGKRAWARVFLPEEPTIPLALVCEQKPGRDRPLMLLSTLAVFSDIQARNVRIYYRQRWSCEEAIEFLKTSVGLEHFAIRRYENFPRLLMLAMWAMAFLTWMLLHAGRMLKGPIGKRPGYRRVQFVYYRVLRFLQELELNLARLPPPSFQNG